VYLLKLFKPNASFCKLQVKTPLQYHPQLSSAAGFMPPLFSTIPNSHQHPASGQKPASLLIPIAPLIFFFFGGEALRHSVPGLFLFPHQCGEWLLLPALLFSLDNWILNLDNWILNSPRSGNEVGQILLDHHTNTKVHTHTNTHTHTKHLHTRDGLPGS